MASGALRGPAGAAGRGLQASFASFLGLRVCRASGTSFRGPSARMLGLVVGFRPPPGEAWPVGPQDHTQKTQKAKVAGFRVS